MPPRIASFVLPLGYSFNLDGSMMYMTFASIFIAQAYGIHLDWGTMITMLLMLMITSKGIAGVPRASLVVITGTLSHFQIPEAGILLILAVDHFLDMGRTATNVVGNAVAATVVARWEGQLDPPQLPMRRSCCRTRRSPGTRTGSRITASLRPKPWPCEATGLKFDSVGGNALNLATFLRGFSRLRRHRPGQRAAGFPAS